MNRKNFLVIISITTVIYLLGLLFTGYFKIGLISDDYYNLYDAVNSTLVQKFSGNLAYTNILHLRPLYYISIQIGYFVHNLEGLDFNNFTNFRAGNLIIFLLFAYVCSKLVLKISSSYNLALTAYLSIILFPSNIHNICWTAGMVDILCGLFYALYLLISFGYLENKKNLYFWASIIFMGCALLTKETAITAFPVLLVLIIFFKGKKALIENKKFLLFQVILIALYLLYKISLGQLNIPQALGESRHITIVKAILGFIIPEDPLTLQYQLKENNLIMLFYFVLFTGFSFIYFIYLFQLKIFKLVFFVIINAIVLISPYIAAGYVRPQLMLIPFSIIVVFLCSASVQKNNLKNLSQKASFISFIPILVFWSVLSCQNILQWKFAYSYSKECMNNFETVNFDKSKYNIVFCNPGRVNQSFMFDKLTGAYNYWKYKQPVIKDTLYDIVLACGLNQWSIKAKIIYEKTDSNHFRINTSDENQFFYIEGFNLSQKSPVFENDKVMIVFSGFNYLKKPTEMTVSVKSPEVNCYLANETNYTRIY